MSFTRRLLIAVAGVGFLAVTVWLASSWWRPSEKIEPRSTPPVTLALERQKAIWTAEHTTFQIEHRFGKAFLEGVAEFDRQRLVGLARPGFRGFVIPGSVRSVRGHSGVEETERSFGDTINPSVASAAELFDALFAHQRLLSEVSSRRLRVLAIQRTPSQPDGWTARLLLTARGRDDKSRPRELESEHVITGVVTDGKKLGSVAWLESWVIERELVRSADAELFTEATAAWNLDQVPLADNWKLSPAQTLQYRFQLATDDFNRDGYPDVAVAALDHRPLLLQGVPGGGFRGVAVDTGLTTGDPREKLSNFAAAWIDYDNDGWPDLVLGDQLYHNEDGRRFTNVTVASQLGFRPECMGCLVADYDSDGLLDLYVIYQKPFGELPTGREKWVEETGSGLDNQLWRNTGNGHFADVTDIARAGGGRRHTHSAAWFFLDDDHFPDLYLANDFGQNVVLRNQGNGTFADVSEETGANGYSTSMGVATGDLDNDGQTDVYVANMYSKMGRRIIGLVDESDYPDGVYRQIQGSCAGNRLYRGIGGGRFREISESAGVNAVGWAYAPLLADFDADGRLDIYATTGFLSFDRTKPDG